MGSDDFCRNGSCNGAAGSGHRDRVGRQELQSGRVQCLPLHAGGKAACGHGIVPGRRGHGGGRCQRSRPSEVVDDAIDGLSAKLLGPGGEMGVNAGRCW